MDTTRRLSLALLLVAPIVAAQDLFYGSQEVFHPEDAYSHESSLSQEPLTLHHENPIYEPEDQFHDGNQEEEHYEHEDVGDGDLGEHQEESPQEYRRKREVISTPGENLVTAEQAFFRPHFHYQRVIHDRYKRKNDFKKDIPLATPSKHLASNNGNPHANEQYVFRGTPFGAVFVHPHHPVYPSRFYHRQH